MSDNYLSTLDIEDMQGVKLKDSAARLAIGTLSDLRTTNKSNLVAAINEVKTDIGTLSDLNTTDKSNLVAAINEALDTDRIYKSIDEMIASNIPVNDVAIVINPEPSYWIIETSGTSSIICHELDNGNFAKLLNVAPINISSLVTYGNMDDISNDVQFLLDNGYNSIIIPEGTFVCNVNVSSHQSISGSHISRTSLIPKNHTRVFNINGDYINISNLWITDVPPYSGYGITIGASAQCNNSHFENVHLENLSSGLLSTGSMIWNEFLNCDFIGCFDHGFVITSGTAYFNNNAFYSCKFNNNVNAAIVIDVAEVHDYDNTFYSCNIEYNAQDRFGQTHTDTYAVLNTGFTSFIGCYFEGNGADNNHYTIQNWDLLNIIGCSLIQERTFIDNNHPGAITNLIGNKQYQCVGYVSTQVTEVNLFGNNFTLS